MISFGLIVAGVVMALPFQPFNDMRGCQTAGINLSMLLEPAKGYEIECKDEATGAFWKIAATPTGL